MSRRSTSSLKRMRTLSTRGTHRGIGCDKGGVSLGVYGFAASIMCFLGAAGQAGHKRNGAVGLGMPLHCP